MSDQPSIVFTDVNERQGTFHRRIFLTGGVVAFGFFAMAGRLYCPPHADRYWIAMAR